MPVYLSFNNNNNNYVNKLKVAYLSKCVDLI